ncbi:hypothetical protein HK107_11725 [Parvularcula sp. ZS-1/3]|uniref:Uncharacterized protein n=1 Tax=Parvularcula mediterranea TaxID=2732508 RepID=A0A7Y3W5U8_9PROT|nr:hypothetical protein [Parvularcula mediterranea]NNU16989.1 hypothetical protein [Parvularcula mediterranea]
MALCVQLIAALLWAGAAAHRLTALEAKLTALPALDVRAARLEEQTVHLSAQMTRIEMKLDRALHEESQR